MTGEKKGKDAGGELVCPQDSQGGGREGAEKKTDEKIKKEWQSQPFSIGGKEGRRVGEGIYAPERNKRRTGRMR